VINVRIRCRLRYSVILLAQTNIAAYWHILCSAIFHCIGKQIQLRFLINCSSHVDCKYEESWILSRDCLLIWCNSRILQQNKRSGANGLRHWSRRRGWLYGSCFLYSRQFKHKLTCATLNVHRSNDKCFITGGINTTTMGVKTRPPSISFFSETIGVCSRTEEENLLGPLYI